MQIHGVVGPGSLPEKESRFYGGVTGPRGNVDASSPNLRLGGSAETAFTRLHGKYFEQSLRGNVFTAANPGSTLMEVYNSTPTLATMCLYNPQNSTKLLSLIRVEIGIATPPSGPLVATYGLYVNNNVSQAVISSGASAVAAYPALLGSGVQPLGQVWIDPSLGTNAAPFRNIQNDLQGSTTTIWGLPCAAIDLDGTCVLMPGAAVSLFQNTSDTTSDAYVFVSWVWEEI